MRTSAIALLLASSAAAAHADDAPEAGDADSRVQARQRFRSGLAHYKLGEFEQAIEELQESYRLYPAPQLLFNLGQASRLAGKLEQALHYYRAFLRDAPDSRQADDARRLGAKVESALDEQRAEAAERARRRDNEDEKVAPERPVEAPKAAPAAVLQRVDRTGGQRIAGLAVAGGGLALLGTSVYFGLSARSASSEIEELSENRGRWSADELATYRRGERHDRLAWILAGGGAAAVATGAVLYFMGRSDESKLVVSSNGRSLAIGARF